MHGAIEDEQDSIWTKLHRRKMVQWGLAYVAVAWGLLQGLQFLGDAFGWPGHVLRLGTLVALVGLPIVLVLAWFHGDRGHQRPIRSEIAILAALLLLGGAGLWLYQRSIESDAESPAEAARARAIAPSERKAAASVAVLPFANLSTDPANEYLAEGIAETLITVLAQVPRLMVIGKVSSFSYKGQAVDPRTIGQQLGVGALLEGSVQRAGDRLRVAVQLVSTGDGGHLWAETYDRPTTDVFAVQDDIARRVVAVLSVALAGKSGPGSIGTTNVAAYDAYLRGRQLVDRRETKALEEGVALLEEAVALDPAFARAWVTLADAYELSSRDEGLTTIGRMPSEQAFALSERAARRAVAAAPELGVAHAALGRALELRDKAGFAEEYERAIALSPDDPATIIQYAPYLRGTSRAGEALAAFERALAVEPRNARLRDYFAGALDSSGDIQRALGQYREAIRLEPDSVLAYQRAGETLGMTTGQGDLAARLLRRAAVMDPGNASTALALTAIGIGWDDAALVQQGDQTQRRLGAQRELQTLDAWKARLDGRGQHARALLERLLVDAPLDWNTWHFLVRVPGTTAEYRETLRRVEELTASSRAKDNDVLADAVVCLNSWIGNEQAASDELARWEPDWRSRHAFGFMSEGARYDALLRSLACVGRSGDALTELESLVKEGYNIGWREMAVDPAYDGIRADPRFRAITGELEAADAAARARFRARPDLNDADIESLGT